MVNHIIKMNKKIIILIVITAWDSMRLLLSNS